MKTIVSIVFVVLLIVGLWIRLNPDEYRNRAVCELFAEFKTSSFNGVVEKKFLDEEHHLHEAIFVDNQEHHFNHDKSGFYTFIQEGDSIIKKEGSESVVIYRQGKMVEQYEIDFGCQSDASN